MSPTTPLPRHPRVELLGASGVGKSTLLAEVGGPGARWFGPAAITEAGLEALGRPSRNRLEREAVDDPRLRAFVEACLDSVQRSSLPPSGRIAATTFLRRSAADAAIARAADLPGVMVHDELLLHRGFSILPRAGDVEGESRRFFELAPVPDVAVVVRAATDVVLERATARGALPNCYRGLDEPGLRAVVDDCGLITDVAVDTLRRRGVVVHELDTTGSVFDGARRLAMLLDTLTPGGPTVNPDDDDLRGRLREASGSFRKKAGRHELRTRDVMYCAFSTPGFTVTPEESQRDAARRLANFGLDRDAVAGRSALDLGSNAGAMLFELGNLGVARGLGVEYDQDKVDLATEIAGLSDLSHLQFRQGDIDQLDSDELGTFDLVLALAIEGHVQQPERLYELLGRVTGSTLYFEGNNRCDVEDTTRRLLAAGFADVTPLGFCDDDRDARNNTRPMLVATRGPAPAPDAARGRDRWWRRRG